MEYRSEDFLSYKLHMIKTNKFKTINVKVVFSNEIKKDEITIRNVLSDILTYSSKKYDTNKKLITKMQDLYAAKIFSSSYRIGKLYNTDINAVFLNEKYTEEGMFEETLELLSEIIFNPNVKDFEFDSKSFSIVKDINKVQLQSIKENLRKYGLIRMLDEMGRDEDYSLHSYGYSDDLEKLDAKSLYEYYLKFLKTSNVDIYILGNIDFEKTKKLVNKLFKFNTIKMKRKNIIIEHKKINNKVKKYVEEMNISQSKLSIGCKISNINDFDRNYVLPIFSIILGGGSSSKLFNNVREKNSLCYYISASGNKLDNILFITSGINAKNYDKCLLLIKKELKNMQKGNFTEDDIEKAKTQYITMLDELWEDPFQIISFYYSIGILNKDDYDTRKKNIMSVKYEDIKRISNNIHMDTIFLLKGNE